MDTSRNKTSFLDSISGPGKQLETVLLTRPMAWYRDLREKTRDLPRTNFLLGCKFAEESRWLDAIFRFKFAVWLQPNFPRAWYNLGVCYVRVGKRAEAKRAFLRTLTQRPGDPETLFMLSGLDPASVPAAQRPTRMARATVIDFFTRYAANYDAIMEQTQYHGARIMFDQVKPLLPRTNGLNVLDLGCGTGLIGKSWRGLAQTLRGIDFCEPMLEHARAQQLNNKPVYDTILVDELIDMNPAAIEPKSQDVILLADTAQFLGELSSFFVKVAGWLRPGGVFALTIEPLGASAGYAVNPDTARFGHHPEYIKKMAANAGLELRKEQRVNLYATMPAQLFVFAAKAGTSE